MSQLLEERKDESPWKQECDISLSLCIHFRWDEC